MDYRNPTLTEIIAELHLEAGTLPEKSFMALAREFAAHDLDDQEFGHMVIVENQDQGQETEPKIVPRIRCWDRERIRLVQFSPDVVYVNLIGEYPGWGKFIEHIRTTRASIENALKGDLQIIRVDLQTIDKWKVAPAGFTIGQYLNCGGRLIPEWYSEVSVSSDISLGQGFHHKDGFNKKVNVRVRTSEDNVQFQILIVLGVTDQQRDFDTLMNKLHSESVECFEALITDRVRNEVMGGRQ
jgi:uncharacterized protein (TIGR04255 family)